MSFLVISSSLNPKSRSSYLAREAKKSLEARQIPTDWLDLREIELPHCDGGGAYSHPNVALVSKKIADATCILLAVAIYNYDCGSSTKNLVELTGKAWEDKTVAFLCAAGGRSSYMSIMSLANSLMLDFRSLIVPRFVYAEGSSFHQEGISDAEIHKRIEQLVDASIKLDGALLQAKA